jgi:hypothetical protein
LDAPLPAIVRTALELPAKSFTMDGEAVVCGGDGIAVFAHLHRRGVVTDAMLYAFDLLQFGGHREPLRGLPKDGRGEAAEAGGDGANGNRENASVHIIGPGRAIGLAIMLSRPLFHNRFAQRVSAAPSPRTRP